MMACPRVSACLRQACLNSTKLRILPANTTRLQACRKWVLRPSCSTSQTCLTRLYSTDVIPPAAVEGADKDYAPKITALVDDISKLTLLEVADLNELLKKTLNIADTPVMAMGAAMGAPAKAEEPEEEEETKHQKTFFSVKLTGFDSAKKVALIKEIKALIPGMNLVQAKKFVESTPQTVLGDLTQPEADDLQKALEAAGGKVQVD